MRIAFKIGLSPTIRQLISRRRFLGNRGAEVSPRALGAGLIAAIAVTACTVPRVVPVDIPPYHVEPDGSSALTSSDHRGAAEQHRKMARADWDLAAIFSSASLQCLKKRKHQRHTHRLPTECSRAHHAEYWAIANRAAREDGLAMTHERLAKELGENEARQVAPSAPVEERS